MELSIKVVANRLGVTYHTVLNCIKRGQLGALRRGGKWYIEEAEMLRFQKEGNREVDPIDLNTISEEV